MLKYVKQSDEKQFIIVTETGIVHSLKKENPEKEFIPVVSKAVCPNMKKIPLEKVLWALEDLETSPKSNSKYRITVPEEIAEKAKKALNRMVEILPKN